MNPFQVLSRYRALNPAQKQILRDKRLELSMPPDAWFRFLREISDFDRHGDSTRKVFGVLAIVLPVLALISGIIAGKGGLPQSAMPWVFGSIGGLFLLCFAIWASLRGQDLDNKLRDFVMPMILVLREEMNPKDKLTLEADFRGAQSDDKLISERTFNPEGGHYPEVNETIYSDPWLIGKARFADGGSLVWRIEEKLRKRAICKRNPRGKIKHKNKFKIKQQISIRLGLPRKRYQLVSAGQDELSNDRVEIRETDKRYTFKIQRTSISDEPGSGLRIQEFLDPLAEAYRRVRPVTKKQGDMP